MFLVMLEIGEEWATDESHRVNGTFDCEIAVSPNLAKRRAGVYLAMHVTMMTLAGTPTLVLGKNPVWRCPVYFNYLPIGEVGTLGTIEVDAQTGEAIPLTSEEILAMQERANAIATHLAPRAVATI